MRSPKRRRNDDLEYLILGVAASERIEILIGHGVGTRTDLLHQGHQLLWRVPFCDRLTQLGRRRAGSKQERRSGGVSERRETIIHRFIVPEKRSALS